MRVISFLFMLIMSAGLFVTGVIYVIAKAISRISFNPESAAWKRMLEKLRERLNTKTASNLVPWDAEMLSLLSLNKSLSKKPGFFDSIEEGVFMTIYQEPVLAYVTQKSGKTSVTVARSSDREIIFRNKENETEIWVNGQPFGLFINGSLLAPGKNSQLMARLPEVAGEDQQPILVGNQVLASLSNPARSAGPNPRALSLLKSVNPQEENMVLALTVYQLTR
jgi:hypothetical protein